jgi:hypothetical protein
MTVAIDLSYDSKKQSETSLSLPHKKISQHSTLAKEDNMINLSFITPLEIYDANCS